jgi:hypothetical protein
MTDAPEDTIPEPPPRDPVQEWRDRLAKFKAECSADFLERYPELEALQAQHQAELSRTYAPVLKAVAKLMKKELAAVRREIDAVKVQLRREIQSARRPERRKKMTKAEIDKFIMSKKGLPETAFEE